MTSGATEAPPPSRCRAPGRSAVRTRRSADLSRGLVGSFFWQSTTACSAAECHNFSGSVRAYSRSCALLRIRFAALYNGQLFCEGAGNLPSGSWRDSCRNGYRQGGDLYAECQAANGRWRDASLDLNRCPHGPVGNDNGQLFCEGAGNAGSLPGGSWRDSCRNGNRQGAQLYAQCRAANGKWRDASLDLGRCPRGPVGNDNGRLFCGARAMRATCRAAGGATAAATAIARAPSSTPNANRRTASGATPRSISATVRAAQSATTTAGCSARPADPPRRSYSTRTRASAVAL